MPAAANADAVITAKTRSDGEAPPPADTHAYAMAGNAIAHGTTNIAIAKFAAAFNCLLRYAACAVMAAAVNESAKNGIKSSLLRKMTTPANPSSRHHANVAPFCSLVMAITIR